MRMDYNKEEEELNNHEKFSNILNIFRDKIDFYFKVVEIHEKSEGKIEIGRIKRIISCNEHLQTYFNNCLTNNGKFNQVITNLFLVLEAHRVPLKNTVVNIFKFFFRKQYEDEPLEEYLADLKHLVKSCHFGVQENKLLHYQIVNGIYWPSFQNYVKTDLSQRETDGTKEDENEGIQDAQGIQDREDFDDTEFIYESEKEPPNAPHKQLLSQIQTGIKLRKVKCDDRSKPNLDGLRKFRRQMTIEEQIQKSMSMADVVAAAAEPDELDDIDKVRDDLQSAKQMLAQELRNKEALERENKRLMARLLNLEVELEKEKNAKKIDTEKGAVVQARSAADEKLVQQLKEEAAEAHRMAKEMEDKYRGTAEELDSTRAKLESAWLRNQQLELELKAGSRSNAPLSKQMSSKKLAASTVAMPNGKTGPESEEESEYTEETETETESEEEDGEVDAAAVQERRVARELKLLATKLRSYKDKTGTALKERRSLREQLRKQQKQLRQEKKKYKALQKEVDKMAKLMKDDEDDEEEERPEDEEEEEEETESESESEESEEEEELTDGDLPEDAPVEDKRKNLTDRSKHYETRLGTLKKGNYLLKANIDRLQDDINRQREMSLTLQEDLNSVLAELG